MSQSNPDQGDTLPDPQIGCGTWIGTPGEERRCGDHGICPKCWAVKNDQDVDRLRLERDHYKRLAERPRSYADEFGDLGGYGGES